MKGREKRRRRAYAAVLAIWPNSPGPCDTCWGGIVAVGACCCGGGAAMVVAGRRCWGAGAEAVGREGARPTERWRGILGFEFCFGFGEERKEGTSWI